MNNKQPSLFGVLFVGALAAFSLVACNQQTVEEDDPTAGDMSSHSDDKRGVSYTQQRQPCEHYTDERLALFGDTHVHTSLSFDAAANSIGATPADANRFARGEAIDFWPLDKDGKPNGKYKIERPLDFLAVTDHGEFLGERRLCMESGSPSYDTAFCKSYRSDQRTGMMLLGDVITTETPKRIAEICGADGSLCSDYASAPWQQMIDAANAANDTSSGCEFTSFIAYEYTGTPGTSNYHRNVIFRNETVPSLPVSYVDAPYDSALWSQLDAVCEKSEGCDYLTIPHNSNLANSRMAPYMRLPPTIENRKSYARTRQQREPIMEVFQHKGNSECINGLTSILGQPDELCEIESVRTMGKSEAFMERSIDGANIVMSEATEVTEECAEGTIGANGMLGAGCVGATDYLRSGLLVGLVEENAIGENPVKLGVIAATDTHAASPGAVSEKDWRGHVSVEATPEERLKPGLLTSGIDGNPGGLAGVWAVENSRDAIFEAMQRREVFGTTGPRIVPRFFAGWDYDQNLCSNSDMVKTAYANGVPMGGDMSAASGPDSRPTIIASVLRDPEGDTALQKMQLIKGWVDADGAMHNKVIELTDKPEQNHDSFCVVYKDEDFDPALSSYYYVRAVEHPIPRWSVYDCQRLPEARRPAVCSDGSYPSTIQEMAWTSPIWYRPN